MKEIELIEIKKDVLLALRITGSLAKNSGRHVD